MNFMLDNKDLIDHCDYQRTAIFKHLFQAIVDGVFNGAPLSEIVVKEELREHEGLVTNRVYISTATSLRAPDETEAMIILERVVGSTADDEGLTYDEDEFGDESGNKFMPMDELFEQINAITIKAIPGFNEGPLRQHILGVGSSQKQQIPYAGLTKTLPDVLDVIGETLTFLPLPRFEACVLYNTLEDQLKEGEAFIYLRLKKTPSNIDLPEDIVETFWVCITIRTPEMFNL